MQEDTNRIAPEYGRDLITGLVITAIGAAALIEAMRYSFGSPASPGSALFPALASALMIVIGLGMSVTAFLRIRGTEQRLLPGRPDLTGLWSQARPVLAVCASILVFFALFERTGLAPAIFCTVFVARLSESPVRVVESILLAAGLAVASALIFVFMLGLPFDMWRMPRW